MTEHGLLAGDVGVVVGVYGDSQAYEVEFSTRDGQTLDVVTVEAHQLLAVSNREILHARPLT
ncbi:MAG: DUF4926 domain-containing protein [Anaerolineae bacterium]